MREQIPMKPAAAVAAPTTVFTPAPFATLQRKCACGGECPECKKKRVLQRAPRGTGSLPRSIGVPPVSGHGQDGHATVPPIVHDVLRSPGEPLDPATRAFMEPRFGHDFSKVRVHTGSPIPGNLVMNHPGDHYEQEAERVADQVMRMPETPRAARGSDPARASRAAAAAVYRAASSPAAGRAAPPIVNEALRSPGQPLPASTQEFFRARFGHDFGGVRIHTGDQAAESAQAVSALAYTAGQHIVFGAGQYAPGSSEGRRLLAHELVHTVQQTATAGPMVMGKWDSATECSGAQEDKWIKKVVVNQETPQTATLHWSDGSTESDQCSSGKGHCCVDASNPSGVACTVAASQSDGSNCTPITRAAGYQVQNRVRDHGGVNFWTEFVPDRAIALHEYSPIDGTPLSHGCVRLHTDFATKIFCNVRQNATWVQVQGFARPKCDNANLQNEWQDDFTKGGKDPAAADGEEKREILETRKELNAAYGRTLTPAEMQALTAKDIPHCRGTAPLPKPQGS